LYDLYVNTTLFNIYAIDFASFTTKSDEQIATVAITMAEPL